MHGYGRTDCKSTKYFYTLPSFIQISNHEFSFLWQSPSVPQPPLIQITVKDFPGPLSHEPGKAGLPSLWKKEGRRFREAGRIPT